jgi:putative oxidoreductase
MARRAPPGIYNDQKYPAVIGPGGDIMRNAALLGARLLLGGYMGIHASQKLFGKFHGPGLDGITPIFERDGLIPGRELATAASATEITGGLLTITGIAWPAGPLAIAGAMTVATASKRKRGLMAARDGIELPLSYVTLALTLAAAGPGKYKLGPSLHPKLTAVGAIAGGAVAGALIARMVAAEPPVAEAPAPPAPAAPATPATAPAEEPSA